MSQEFDFLNGNAKVVYNSDESVSIFALDYKGDGVVSLGSFHQLNVFYSSKYYLSFLKNIGWNHVKTKNIKLYGFLIDQSDEEQWCVNWFKLYGFNIDYSHCFQM